MPVTVTVILAGPRAPRWRSTVARTARATSTVLACRSATTRDRAHGGRPNVGRGVKFEVGERQTAVDRDLVVEYGVSVAEVATDVRENVIAAVERITGLEVVDVNITVNDVHLPDDEESASAAGAPRGVARPDRGRRGCG